MAYAAWRACTKKSIHCLNRRNGCACAVLTIPSLSATHGMDELGIKSILWQQVATSGAVNSERSYNHTVKRKSVSTLKEQLTDKHSANRYAETVANVEWTAGD